MDRTKRSIGDSLRTIGAIAIKDIVDAVKNKTTISIILGSTLLMLSNSALPLLLNLSDVQRAIIYDPGESGLVEELDEMDQVRAYEVASREEMDTLLGEGQEALGLVLPTLSTEAESIQIEGYYTQWMKDENLRELQTFFEEEISELWGTTVDINVEGNGVYPRPESDGQPFMFSMITSITLLTICGAVVPYLMIEEKETRTLDAVLVSPASYGEVVIGKAAAGMVYGLAAAGVVFLFRSAMIAQWGLAILGAVSGTLFAVAFGLLMGTIFDNPQQMSMWMGLILMVLLVPMFLSVTALHYDWPEVVRFIMPRLPSSALARVFRTCLSDSIPVDTVLTDLGIILGSSAVMFTAVVWLVRRTDR
jgi:ABC-2 type transport system permease protein